MVKRFFDFDDLLTDWHQKFLSDAQIDTLRKICWRFQLNQSSPLGEVVRTKFFKQGDGWTDRQGVFIKNLNTTKDIGYRCKENTLLFDSFSAWSRSKGQKLS